MITKEENHDNKIKINASNEEMSTTISALLHEYALKNEFDNTNLSALSIIYRKNRKYGTCKPASNHVK